MALGLRCGQIGNLRRPSWYHDRAIALAASGDYPAAQTDLDTAKQRDVNPDDFLVVQSYLFRKQGKKREARAAMSQAKRFNRAAQEIAV